MWDFIFPSYIMCLLKVAQIRWVPWVGAVGGCRGWVPWVGAEGGCRGWEPWVGAVVGTFCGCMLYCLYVSGGRQFVHAVCCHLSLITLIARTFLADAAQRCQMWVDLHEPYQYPCDDYFPSVHQHGCISYPDSSSYPLSASDITPTMVHILTILSIILNSWAM